MTVMAAVNMVTLAMMPVSRAAAIMEANQMALVMTASMVTTFITNKAPLMRPNILQLISKTKV